MSTGIVTSLTGETSEGLGRFVAATPAGHHDSEVPHLDEPRAKVAGKLGSVHSAPRTPTAAHLFHRRRGRVARDEFTVLPGYEGMAVHDGWTPYRHYGAKHQLCGAPRPRTPCRE